MTDFSVPTQDRLIRPRSKALGLFDECRERGIEAHDCYGGLSEECRKLSEERVARKIRDLERAAFDYGVDVELNGLHAEVCEMTSYEKAEGCIVPEHVRWAYDAGRLAVIRARQGDHPGTFEEASTRRAG